jgi:hypothetical protein
MGVEVSKGGNRNNAEENDEQFILDELGKSVIIMLCLPRADERKYLVCARHFY